MMMKQGRAPASSCWCRHQEVEDVEGGGDSN